MKKEYYYFLFLGLLLSCLNEKDYSRSQKMIPDHTLYVAGMIEYSSDTTHHYPEIVVGYFTQVIRKDEPYSREDYLTEYTGIYTPILLRQVQATAHYFKLKWEPETEAIVSITGPLGATKEKKVVLTHEGNGIYGDMNYALPRMPNGKYKLRITLPDGSIFGAVTRIPEAVNFNHSRFYRYSR